MTQEERILEYLSQHEKITGIEALRELSIFRLASRISNLKKKGYKITSKLVPVVNNYGEKCHISEYRIYLP
tara:strand:- start:78 stop:290 length:213 start_codon:yes stop_codon:yes gene_type:complete